MRFLCKALVGFFFSLPYLAALCITVALLGNALCSEGSFTLRHFASLCSDLPRWLVLLRNSVIVGGCATAIALAAGLGLAIVTFKIAWPGRPVMLVLVLVGACVPTYVTSSAVLSEIGMTSFRESAWMAGVIHGVTYVPLAALLIGLGLAHVEPELEESASLEASPGRVLLSISIPRAAWSMAATGLIVFWLVLTDYSITDVLQVRTFAEEVFTQYQLAGWGSAAVLPALPVMLVCGAAFVILARWAGVLARPLFQGQAPQTYALGVGRGAHAVSWGVLVVALIGVVWVYIELVGRIDFNARVGVPSGDELHGQEYLPVPPSHLHGRAKWWVEVRSIWPEWRNTMVMAILSGCAATVLAFGVAWVWARSRWWRGVSAGLMLVLVCVPGPALGMTVYSWYGYGWPAWLIPLVDGVYDGVGIYVVVLVLRFLPVAVLMMLPAVQRVPGTLDEAATLDGADWLARLMKLYWPEVRGSAALAAVVVMILAIGELNCVNIVAPPGMGTLSTRLFSFLHSGVDSQAATVCLAAALTAAPPAMMLFGAVHRRSR